MVKFILTNGVIQLSQVRMGIIGTGLRSSIAEYWHQPKGNSIVVGAADIRSDWLEKFREKVNPDCFTILDYRELLERDDIDAIAVLSPDYLHEEHAIAALEAG